MGNCCLSDKKDKAEKKKKKNLKLGFFNDFFCINNKKDEGIAIGTEE